MCKKYVKCVGKSDPIVASMLKFCRGQSRCQISLLNQFHAIDLTSQNANTFHDIYIYIYIFKE